MLWCYSVTYKCSAHLKHRVHTFDKTQNAKVQQAYSTTKKHKSPKKMWNVDDANFGALLAHDEALKSRKINNIPLEIISPATQLIWLWMCNNWRHNLDFDFKRPNGWNDDMSVRKFNHSFYLKFHNILDWHDFALLANNTFLYPGLVVNPHIKKTPLTYYVIDSITYQIPQNILDFVKKEQFYKLDNYEWQPECCIHYRRLWKRMQQWVLVDDIKTVEIFADCNWTVCDRNQFVGNVVRRTSSDIYSFESTVLPPVHTQHPDVASNKPFFFFILGCDEYHHTQFTGLNSMKTHGFYWWIGNFTKELQFTRSCSMNLCQAPAILSLTTVMPIIYSHFEHVMNHGCLLWCNNGLIRVKGMISHHIADMVDRLALMRRRGSSKESRSEGMLWYGCKEGVKWPIECDNLLQLHTVTPGPYLLKIRQLIQRKFGMNNNTSDKIGKTISLTNTESDIFNELPIASSLKAPLEINHTAMLGVLGRAFEIEWTRLHTTAKFAEINTRSVMIAYLNKYWIGINGVSCYVQNINTNLLVFNQIHRSWQTMVEILMSLPHVVDWDGNINLLCNLVRITGCLRTCVSETRRKQLKRVLVIILSASLVDVFVKFCKKNCK